eukprot:CAMPEP_0175440292 /NCGR_PEP_ID=MMETSP0095-20121207/56992_1 /TAXON_ID=311494 /ORGANISM="Alexandrium monilatum, Strain CCMP3105" /LENGTH=70 /DNA_ID=CAMNT_0016740155 /DNA_START=1 /DNA_END=210 /DNA_ORIENTATION=-
MAEPAHEDGHPSPRQKAEGQPCTCYSACFDEEDTHVEHIADAAEDPEAPPAELPEGRSNWAKSAGLAEGR